MTSTLDFNNDIAIIRKKDYLYLKESLNPFKKISSNVYLHSIVRCSSNLIYICFIDFDKLIHCIKYENQKLRVIYTFKVNISIKSILELKLFYNNNSLDIILITVNKKNKHDINYFNLNLYNYNLLHNTILNTSIIENKVCTILKYENYLMFNYNNDLNTSYFNKFNVFDIRQKHFFEICDIDILNMLFIYKNSLKY